MKKEKLLFGVQFFYILKFQIEKNRIGYFIFVKTMKKQKKGKQRRMKIFEFILQCF